LFAVIFAGLPAFAAQESLDIKNLIDLSGFNFTVAGVRTVDEILQLGDTGRSNSIKDEYKKDRHFVIVSLKGQVDRPGTFILSPHAFVAEYISDNSWKIDSAVALSTTFVLMGGTKRTFWVQSDLAETISLTASKKGGEENIEVVFVLPKKIMSMKLGTARFISEDVAIASP
jgi:hypothetical protein